MADGQTGAAGALREVWFWSGVFRDHATFLHDNLAPDQPQWIRWAEGFRQTLTRMHDETADVAAKAGLGGPAGSYVLTGPPEAEPLTGLQGRELAFYEQKAADLSRSLLETIGSLRNYKEQVLQQKLDCQIKLALGPTLIAHMIVEAEEAQRTLGRSRAVANLPPALQALHHHLVWLPDAAGHAAALHGRLDGVEQNLLNRTADFKHVLNGMHIKALELYSMLRVAPRMVGALRRLNRDAMTQIAVFRSFLTELREHTEECEVLGAIMPILADHMLREELYYSEKVTAIPEG